MLRQLLMMLLLLLAVQGTQQGIANKLRKQREKRKRAARLLNTEKEQQFDSESAPSTVKEGMVIYLDREEQDTLPLEVPADADIAHVAAAAVASGVDTVG